jgi:hypothetical protein
MKRIAGICIKYASLMQILQDSFCKGEKDSAKAVVLKSTNLFLT